MLMRACQAGLARMTRNALNTAMFGKELLIFLMFMLDPLVPAP